MRRILALIPTYLFQPILVPAYGIGLIGVSSFFYDYSPVLKSVILGISFLIAVIAPLMWYLLLRMTGVITTSQASDRHERKWAYLFTLSAYAAVAFLCFYFGVELYYTYLWVGAFFALSVVYVVNYFWKISAHATGMGGLMGAVIFLSFFFYKMPLFLIIVLSLCSGWVTWSRLELKAHTPGQLIAGYALGLFSMLFLPFCTFF